MGMKDQAMTYHNPKLPSFGFPPTRKDSNPKWPIQMASTEFHFSSPHSRHCQDMAPSSNPTQPIGFGQAEQEATKPQPGHPRRFHPKIAPAAPACPPAVVKASTKKISTTALTSRPRPPVISRALWCGKQCLVFFKGNQ